jgi:transcriptional regulator
MYSPKHYRSANPEFAYEIMQRFDFATLITTRVTTRLMTPSSSANELMDASRALPQLSHLPLMTEVLPNGEIELVGHMARANPQWKDFAAGPVTALFQGPHAYISPAWYAPSAGNVPTWNYAAVHAVGRGRVIEDGPKAYAIMQKLTQRFESRYETGWSMADAVSDEHAKLLNAIVVFRIAVDSLDAKFKLSQNQVAENRSGAIQGLEKIGSDEALALVDLMRRIDR